VLVGTFPNSFRFQRGTGTRAVRPTLEQVPPLLGAICPTVTAPAGGPSANPQASAVSAIAQGTHLRLLIRPGLHYPRRFGTSLPGGCAKRATKARQAPSGRSWIRTRDLFLIRSEPLAISAGRIGTHPPFLAARADSGDPWDSVDGR